MHALYVPCNCVTKRQSTVGIPDHGRLTLVGDADSLDVFNVVTIVQEDVCSSVDTLLYSVNNFPGVVFMPSGPVRNIARAVGSERVLTLIGGIFG